MKTVLSIQKDKFYINDTLTYSEIKNCPSKNRGLLMNARFIQGVFDDQLDIRRFNRFGKKFNKDENTNELINALPEWYKYGVRAITVGFQGGGPCFTIDNCTIKNTPYSEDGKELCPEYLHRMKKIIKAADELGMVVILSLFYGAQARFLKDDAAVIQAVKTASLWVREQRFSNVIIEIANEHNVSSFKIHPILFTEDGIADLIKIAQRESGGIPVGCSGTGGYFSKKIAQQSDVILIHGNGLSRQYFYNLIQKAKEIKPIRPIVCNEDSQAISQLEVAFREGVSWGYYNNMTKQEPPVYWNVTKGEDEFFSMRLSEFLGIAKVKVPLEEQFYLQGLENHMKYKGQRFIRLASIYPEKINYVEFYRNGAYIETAYDDPYSINYVSNWLQKPFCGIMGGEEWIAKITLIDNTVINKKITVKS